jgi:hypothetical protein
MEGSNYIMHKAVDKSVLLYGFNITLAVRDLFCSALSKQLNHGETMKISLIIEGESYEVNLCNINFSKSKFPTHNDIMQIRYTAKSPIALKLREIFSATANYTDSMQIIGQSKIIIPEYIKEYFDLYPTSIPDTFYLEPLCAVNHLPKIEHLMTEEEFELGSVGWVAKDIDSEHAKQISQIRAIDYTICENLKKLYDFRCQITGEDCGEKYGCSVIEAHHIESFIHSQNNSLSNIIILSPTFHRIIHRFNPEFNKDRLEFCFPNGTVEKIKFNKHLGLV